MDTLNNYSALPDNGSTTPRADMYQIEYHIFLRNGFLVFMFLALICILGAIGNVHVLIVYFKKYQLSNVKVFITSLATSDLIMSVTTIPVFMFDTRRNLTYVGDGLCQFSRWLSVTLFLASTLLQTLVALERYKKVCKPFNKQWTAKQVIIVTMSIFVISALVCSPKFGQYGDISKRWPNFPEIEGRTCGATKRLQSTLHTTVLFVMVSVCLIIVVVIYALILKAIIRRKKTFKSVRLNRRSSSLVAMTSTEESITSAELSSEMKSMDKPRLDTSLDSNSSARQKIRSRKIQKACKISMMFMFVFIFSYIGIIPSIFLNIVRAVNSDRFTEWRESLGQMMDILLFGGLLNYMVNPIVYFVTDRKYRHHIRKLYRRCFQF